jgi:hypothetical protein
MSENDNNFLPKEKQEKALKWLNDKWPQHKRECEICGTSNWDIQPFLTTPLLYKDNSINLGGMSVPQVSVVCKNCSNTKYFSAIRMGLEEVKKDGENNREK